MNQSFLFLGTTTCLLQNLYQNNRLSFFILFMSKKELEFSHAYIYFYMFFINIEYMWIGENNGKTMSRLKAHFATRINAQKYCHYIFNGILRSNDALTKCVVIDGILNDSMSCYWWCKMLILVEFSCYIICQKYHDMIRHVHYRQVISIL